MSFTFSLDMEEHLGTETAADLHVNTCGGRVRVWLFENKKEILCQLVWKSFYCEQVKIC